MTASESPDSPPRIGPMQTIEGVGAKLFFALFVVTLPLGPILLLWIDPVAAWLIGGVVCFAAAGCAAGFYWAARYTARTIARLQEGKAVIRWIYGPEEWRSFAEQEWQAARHEARDWKPIFVVAVVAGAFGGLVARKVNPLLGFLIVFAGFLLLGFLINWSTWLRGRQAYRRACRRQEDVLIDEHGVLYNGQYHFWATFGTRIEEARVIPGSPAVLQVHTCQGGGRRTFRNTIRVPIPAGRQADAESLAASLLRS